ncbi:MAG TPA: hypothetical protein VKV21_14665 [Solirubrobacteraceae bacterium]|nr:hypothetical protein [Solirubrobacteraceae bacterium]
MKRIVALLTSLALLIPGAAVASANSTSAGYSHHGAVKHVTASRKPSSNSTTPSVSNTSTTQAGSLPFTGLDVGALAAGAVVLLGAGIVLRRVSATDRT